MLRWSTSRTGARMNTGAGQPERTHVPCTGWMDRRAVVTVFGIISLSWMCLPACAQMRVPPETVQQWANTFGKQLSALSTRYSGSLLLQKGTKDNMTTYQLEPPSVNLGERVRKGGVKRWRQEAGSLT
ncbi:hypothetical protein AOLI_G00314730 [Acnodon oligacanthus]